MSDFQIGRNCATFVYLLAAHVVGPTTIAQEALFDTSLIVNGDAEAGESGWVTNGSFTVVPYGASGGFPTAASPGPPERGALFFAGGDDTDYSSAWQEVDLSGIAAVIDTLSVECAVSGFLGGFISQDDSAILTVTFRDHSLSLLGSVSIGPVTVHDRASETGLLFREAATVLPEATRSLHVLLEMFRGFPGGSYNDGYADNLSVVLRLMPEPPVLRWLNSGGQWYVAWQGIGFALESSPLLGPGADWEKWPEPPVLIHAGPLRWGSSGIPVFPLTLCCRGPHDSVAVRNDSRQPRGLPGRASRGAAQPLDACRGALPGDGREARGRSVQFIGLTRSLGLRSRG